MKKLLLTFGLLLAMAFPSHASNATLNLQTAANVAIVDLALTSGVAVFTNAINVLNSAGNLTLLIDEDIAGGTGDIDITIEYSKDGNNWFVEQTRSDEVGTFAARVIAVAVQNEQISLTIAHAPTKFIRIKFDPDANSELTATLVYERR